MPPEQNEQERREIIRRLERRYQEAQTKSLKAEAEAAEARRAEAALLDAHRRAQLPFPAGDICPECWLTHGRALVTVHVQSGPLEPLRSRPLLQSIPTKAAKPSQSRKAKGRARPPGS